MITEVFRVAHRDSHQPRLGCAWGAAGRGQGGTRNVFPGWQFSVAQSAVRVEKRIAWARLFFNTDRFTTVTPTQRASSVTVNPRSSSSASSRHCTQHRARSRPEPPPQPLRTRPGCRSTASAPGGLQRTCPHHLNTVSLAWSMSCVLLTARRPNRDLSKLLGNDGIAAIKTTLLAALRGCVPAGERIVCVEEAPNLQPGHPHVVRLATRAPNIEGAGEVTLRDLVRQALRMCPDCLVVGEVRGPEVWELLVALNTGHQGGVGTLHANSPAEVPARLEALAALGGMPRHALHSQLAAVVHVVRCDRARRPSAVGCWNAMGIWFASFGAGRTGAGDRGSNTCGTCSRATAGVWCAERGAGRAGCCGAVLAGWCGPGSTHRVGPPTGAGTGSRDRSGLDQAVLPPAGGPGCGAWCAVGWHGRSL
jgi:hypothetical protein